MKRKPATRATVLRIPRSLHDRLIRIAADRSIREGRTVSVNRLIVEAVDKSLS